jgi:hypothetical protein
VRRTGEGPGSTGAGEREVRVATAPSIDRTRTVRTNPPRRLHEPFTPRREYPRRTEAIRKEGAMRRGWGVVAAALGAVVLVGVAVGAYHAGVDAGVMGGADAGHVVEVVGPGYGYWHGGFFPFGLLFFPLVVIGIVLLVRFAVAPRGWGHGWNHHGDHPHGPWSDEGRARFEERFGEWHRRQHDQGSTSPDPGGGAAS